DAMSPAEFHASLRARSEMIVSRLALSGWRFWDRTVPRNAELRKNLERLHTAIADARRLERDGKLDDDARAVLEELLAPEPPNNTDALGEILEEVDQALIAVGDETFLCALLEVEYERDEQEGGTGITTWRTVYKKRPFAASIEYAGGGSVAAASLEEARRKLSMLYRSRQSLYGLSRARSGTKAMRLVWLAPVMAGLALALILVVDLAADDVSWRGGLLVAIAGALGATLSGALKLRDQLPRIASLRTFWYAFALQVPIGAVAGLFLWIVLESGLVEIAGQGTDWAVEAAVAFAAGFSEPFVLKTVERIAGGGD
ncbi:MAG: hypothetical protein ACRDM9_14165, partial [Gaiellaceae bacterium]